MRWAFSFLRCYQVYRRIINQKRTIFCSTSELHVDLHSSASLLNLTRMRRMSSWSLWKAMLPGGTAICDMAPGMFSPIPGLEKSTGIDWRRERSLRLISLEFLAKVMPARELLWNCSLFKFPELFSVDLTAILKTMWLWLMVNQALTLMEIYSQISNIPLRISDHDLMRHVTTFYSQKRLLCCVLVPPQPRYSLFTADGIIPPLSFWIYIHWTISFPRSKFTFPLLSGPIFLDCSPCGKLPPYIHGIE